MARLDYPDLDTLSPEKRLYIERSGGLNLLRMLGHAEKGIFDGFNQFSRALMQNPELDPQLRELAVLRVGHLSGSRYEVYHHEAIGRGVGLSDAQIAATAPGGDTAALDEAQRAVLRFTDSLIRDVRAEDTVLAELRGHIGDRAIVDLIMTIGGYMMVARLLETAGIELDEIPLSVGRIAKGGSQGG